MGHLLASVNPSAAAAIQPLSPRPRLPGVGSMVAYTMRRGFGRQGRTQFAAVVQGHGDNGTLNLTVIIDAGDLIDEQFVQPAGPGTDEGNYWEWPDNGVPVDDGFRGTVASLHQRVGEMEDNLADLRAIILGDYDVPKVALFEIFGKLEARLKAVEKGRGK